MTVQDASREDTIAFLASMGIVLDKDTKMPADMLDKRVDQALDASQQFEHIIATTPVDPTAFPTWSSDMSLFQYTRRNNLTENVEGTMLAPKLADLARKEDTFKEMRQTLNYIAYACDRHRKDTLLLNSKQQRGIFIRILEVYNVKDNVPLFLCVYKELVPTLDTSMDDLLRLFQSDEDTRQTIDINELEARALLQLFRKNSKKLHPKHQGLIDQKGGKNMKIYASFLLPLNPISQRGVGSLSDSGCYLCGKKTNSLCQGCLSVCYCGKECQIADWKSHKPACRSLKGGTWKTITLSGTPDNFYTSLMNRNDSLQQTAPISVSSGSTPPNTHKGKIFLAKFQVGMTFNGARPGHMMIYDRQRSFQMFWMRPTERALFDEATDIIGQRFKFYRWLRCVSGNQYQICLDRAPQQDPLW